MTVVKLTTYLMPKDLTSTALLLHYGLELHNLTPSGIMHIAAFVTLCEAYMGIDSFWGGAWLSTSSLGMALILISTSPCPN
jgi:hypothetical protein